MIIPIFVPHCGCPNDCAFCNQRTISGTAAAPTVAETRNVIEEHLSTMGGYAEQIAFFGGSFTGIPTDEQNAYLRLAAEYIKKGAVKSIRLSTRPDYINRDTVLRLQSYGTENIELGAQSMCDDVLLAAHRGHSAADVRRAAETITKCGATLSLQMMTGLPLDTREKDIYTAQCFAELGARETRIYPTLVLRGTQLCTLYENGRYNPQTTEQAVELCAELCAIFEKSGIRILRIGLPESASLRQNFVGGPYHPSIGEMVMSRRIRNEAENAAQGGKHVTILADRRCLSQVYGNKKCNLKYFEEKGLDVSVSPCDNFGTVKITASD